MVTAAAKGDRVVRAERIPTPFHGVLTQGAALLGVTVSSVRERQHCARVEGDEMVGARPVPGACHGVLAQGAGSQPHQITEAVMSVIARTPGIRSIAAPELASASRSVWGMG